MFYIAEDKTVNLTRGDVAVIEVRAVERGGGTHAFQAGDVLRLRVFERNRCDCVVL